MKLRSKSLWVVCLGLLIGSNILSLDWPDMTDTPLMVAIKEGRFQDAIQLIDAGADVNMIVGWDQPHVGHSALGLALKRDAPIEIVEKLIKAGSDVNAYIEPGSYLKSNKDGSSELVRDSFIFNDIIRKKGTPWEHLVARNHTLLSFIVGSKKPIEIVKLLIDSGADVNKLDLHKQGVTPLMVARVVGYDEVIPLLKKAGAREVSFPDSGIKSLLVDLGSWIMSVATQVTTYVKSFFVIS
jgi:ankyrin repeat protein